MLDEELYGFRNAFQCLSLNSAKILRAVAQ